MQSVFHAAASRGFAEHGWLTTHHSFSFASYYDPLRMGFGALRVINDDTIAPEQGFGRHAHDNMEIITIPLAGALAHQDSLGNAAVIETGEIQVMSAGTGVTHSEFNASATLPVSLLQIWILPDKQGVAPRYAQKRFDPSEYTNRLATLVGEIGSAPLGIHQSARLSLGRFETEQRLLYPLRTPQHGVYWLVIEGEAVIADIPLRKRDALGVWATSEVCVVARPDSFILALEVPMLEA